MSLPKSIKTRNCFILKSVKKKWGGNGKKIWMNLSQSAKKPTISHMAISEKNLSKMNYQDPALLLKSRKNISNITEHICFHMCN